jgi:hypothetical protein
MEGQELGIGLVALKGGNLDLTLKIFKFAENTTYAMIPIEQFYDGGEAILNGAPAGTTILGATVNSGIIAGAAWGGASLGAAFFGGELVEPFGGGVLAATGVYVTQTLLPNAPTMGGYIMNGLGNTFSQPIWPPPF